MSKYKPVYPLEPWLDTILQTGIYAGLPRWVEELGLQGDSPPLTPQSFRVLVQSNPWLRRWITDRFTQGYSASMVSVILQVPSTVWRAEQLTPVAQDRRNLSDPLAAAWERQLCRWSDMPDAWAHSLLLDRTVKSSESAFLQHFKEMRKELHNVDTSNTTERRLSPAVLDANKRAVLDPAQQQALISDSVDDLFDPDGYITTADTADERRDTGGVVVQFAPRER